MLQLSADVFQISQQTLSPVVVMLEDNATLIQTDLKII